jgi:hypothetical protein
MKYQFLEDAEKEFLESSLYYNSCQPGLGLDFASEVHQTISRIFQYPQGWTLISRNCRRCLVKRFPYGIIYSVEDDIILIIAVMNLHRKPNYWKSRLKKDK